VRAAVVYDRLIAKGGGERATLVLARTFNADILTTTYDSQKTYPDYSLFKVYTSPLRMLASKRQSRYVAMIQNGLIEAEAAYRFRNMDLSDYDLIITVGHCTKHISIYAQTKRLHYELGVKTSYGLEGLFKPWAMYMKRRDYEATQKIGHLACNSENTRQKMKKHYQRDAEVVYPAVNINMFRPGNSEDYFLAVERISPDKGIETQLEAFRMVPEQKLLVVGSPQDSDTSYFRKLVSLSPQNVTFKGSVTDAELATFYCHSKAAIQTNPEEDLGRVPVEAMASGKPCIAVNAGGFRETIVHGKTGILVDPPYSENLAKAIRNFSGLDFDPNACLERARLFSEETHIEKMKTVVSSL
jgi:glycosyltransferase involved in cell wall biosynthesis